MSPLQVLGVPQVAITVPDLAAGLEFYQSKLGLPVVLRTPQMAILACGTTRILIGTPEQNATGQQTFLYFRVADIRSAHNSLRSLGVAVEGEPHMVGEFEGRQVWLSTFRDGFGMLHHFISEVPATKKTVAAGA